MSAKDKQKKFSCESVLTDDDIGKVLVSFNKEELKYFCDEVNKQFEETGEIINLGKATRNAHYLARIDRGFKNLAEGKGRWVTDEELRRLTYGA